MDNSVSYELSEHTLTPKPFINHLNAANTNDCRAYIDKLEYFGTNYSQGKVVISASRSGYGNARYFFDDAVRSTATPLGASGRAGVLAAGVSTNDIFYARKLIHIFPPAQMYVAISLGVSTETKMEVFPQTEMSFSQVTVAGL